MVFKKKKERRFRAQSAVKWFNKIPVIDFSDSFAPLIYDLTLCIIFLLWMINGWDSDMIDA